MSQNKVDCTDIPGTLTLPDTAPVDSQPVLAHEITSWGHLLPMNDCKHTVRALTEDEYTVGRSPRCDIFFDEHHVNPDMYTHISKFHFKLTKTKDECGVQLVYLEDLSANGTFVNSVRVGRNNKLLLTNNDEISLAKPVFKVFLYMDGSASDGWLPASLRTRYHILKHLGSGGFADVKLIVNKVTCEKYAMKKIKKNVDEGRILSEINILRQIKHPFIIRCEEIIETPETVMMCLEYMPGGDLLRLLNKYFKLRERQAKSVFYQLISAVSYLHSQGITHRDLKPENILTTHPEILSDTIPIKVTDFGLSKVIDSVTKLRTTCGTLKYAAPEILASHGTGVYTNKVDIWSSGVILYFCLSGEHPFSSENNPKECLAAQIMSGKYKMKTSPWKMISSCASDLVKRMLVVDANLRISTSDILRHRWLQDDKLKVAIENVCIDTNSNIASENVPSNYFSAEESPAKRVKLSVC